jgi:hypothetical protein
MSLVEKSLSLYSLDLATSIQIDDLARVTDSKQQLCNLLGWTKISPQVEGLPG